MIQCSIVQCSAQILSGDIFFLNFSIVLTMDLEQLTTSNS